MVSFCSIVTLNLFTSQVYKLYFLLGFIFLNHLFQHLSFFSDLRCTLYYIPNTYIYLDDFPP